MNRFAVFIIFLFCACTSVKKEHGQFGNDEIRNVVDRMTDIMVHDVTNPPLAARFYSYAFLSGYEVVSQNNKAYRNMHRVLNEYPDITEKIPPGEFSYSISAIIAMMETAGRMQPSGKLLIEYEKEFLDSCREEGYSDELIENSKQYASKISDKVLAYAKADGYNRISNFPRYTTVKEEGRWFPTPPAFMAAVEPYFNKVRPFTLDSAAQFMPAPPVKFSSDKTSPFYIMMLKNVQDTLTDAEKDVAAFWDCNPFAVQDNGHLLVGVKKISPGAHWLGITGIACKKAKKEFDESMQIHTTVAIGLMDAFMSCWDEKYRSNRIRPETAIRKFVDPHWSPLLQTPPFPEYPSGHSVISSASAVILTHYFGDNFSFTDDVEVSYGLPEKTFSSFYLAAEEAGMSRFYGGIHFMDAIENGMMQGKSAGQWVLTKVNSKTLAARDTAF